MLINIDQIKVTDRIRKSFGDIEELANDIKENGLINPPVVTPEYELIAGERRLRALQMLDYQQIEVRVMAVNDAEHQLNLEISENEIRKDFSKKERIDYARRLERIERVKARERQATSTGGTSPQLMQNFAEAEKGEVRGIVAEKLNIGSGEQYRKEKFISDNIDSLTPKDFTDWDEGKLSTNKAFQKIKQQLQEKEEQIIGYQQQLKTVQSQQQNIDDLEKKISENEEEQRKLKNRISELVQAGTKIETITKEVDKPETLEKIKILEKQLEEKNQQNIKYSTELVENHKLLSKAMGESTNYQLISHCSEITLKMLDFVKEMSKYDYMAESFNEIPNATRIEYEKCIGAVKKWADRILRIINENINVIDM